MGEYRHYEFLAMDRPLTTDEMAELRALSTRAEITPVSFTNEYNFGWKEKRGTASSGRSSAVRNAKPI